MQITKIKYERQFPIGPYLQERIGFETDIESSDDEQKVWMYIEALRDLAEQSHKKKYPHLYTQSGSPVIIEQREVQEERGMGVTVDDIYSCTDKKVLETYKFLVRGKPELEAAYNEQMQKL